jgi:hypothetical protein
MILKLALFIYIVGALIGAYFLSRTQWAKRISISERLFQTLHIVGALSGIVGVGLTITMPESILSEHIYEVVLMPVFTIYLYVGVALLAQGEDTFDEKQVSNMANAGGLAFGASWIVVLVIDKLHQAEVFPEAVFFPLYHFSALAIYSAAVAYFFRKA